MTEQERYMKLMEERASLMPEMEDIEEEAPAVRPQPVAPQTAPDQTSGKLSAAGDTVAMGGAASGNPYVAGAGLALKTVGMVDDAKRQQEQAKIDAYNKKIMAQRSAIRNFFA